MIIMCTIVHVCIILWIIIIYNIISFNILYNILFNYNYTLYTTEWDLISVLEIVLESIQSLTNLYCTHLCLMRYRSNPLSYDYSWLIINLTVTSMYLFSISNKTICPVKCNFVLTKKWNGRKWPEMASWWTLFWALYVWLKIIIIQLLFKSLCLVYHYHSTMQKSIWVLP